MELPTKPDPTVVCIFGGAGDLAWRKLVPSIYQLHTDGWLPESFGVVGLDRKEMSLKAYRERLLDGVSQFARSGKPDSTVWDSFASHITGYFSGDFSDPSLYKSLADHLAEFDKALNCKANRVFYLAVPPMVIGAITEHLGKAGLAHDRARSRIVVEKPFGSDLESAHALNTRLTAIFHEPQVYRIDHYLGKETVQNVLAFRFANAIFEPVWDRKYIDHVQITVAEELGVEHRGGYYEHAGALRDMVQNHLSQILCFIAMEPPTSFDAEEVRNKTMDVLKAVRIMDLNEVQLYAARGQYGGGWMEGQKVAGYRQEADVAPDSPVETFAAMKLFIDNWRWQDVPFYLRTGKRLPETASEVVIQFHPVPHQPFPTSAVTEQLQSNSLVIRIQPDEGIRLRLEAKRPGPKMQLAPVDMDFTYCQAFNSSPPEAYETLLLDIMRGDATLFMRADRVERAWAIVMPILEAWQALPVDFPNYPAGTWGPETAETLIARDGRSWYAPASQLNKQPMVC